eukprot:TRINITY_DN39987_c0_g1_i1.p1 TRINITY_DN39987_c0_g1~~TRINITY_DN39987_c0_g1_i1.p1  ORF type:complete len:242 (-),score=35.99 TRINITY_DN39987_c0_g1_i1:386-1084(-)
MASSKRRLPRQLQKLGAEDLQKVQSHLKGLLAFGLQEILDLSALDEIISANLSPDEGETQKAEFAPGQAVRVEGLNSAKELNGQTARIVNKDEASGRYIVEFRDASSKKLKAENLIAIPASSSCSSPAPGVKLPPVSPSPKPAERRRSSIPKDAKFDVGDRVRVGGLNGALELNGQLAVVFGYDKATCRYIVEFENGAGQKKLKENNLTGQGVATGALAAKARMFAEMGGQE